MKKYTVTEITQSLKSLIEGTFTETVSIVGEVSNCSRPSSGHIYFVLKDSFSQLKAVFFKRYAMGAGSFIPKNGDKIQALGDIVVYEAEGSYQLIVKRIFYDSEGEFWLKFEETKNRLGEEGLFNDERKKNLPELPLNIALITSLTGAAVKDFIITSQNAGAKFNIEIWGVPVQGNDASLKIANAISMAGKMTNRYDVIVVMRGGGSLEDLSVFNEESVVRAAASSSVPLVSAVGHERDVTVIDFAADKRAATPTAAAVMISENYKKTLKLLADLNDNIIETVVDYIQKYYQKIDYMEVRLFSYSPEMLIRNYKNILEIKKKELLLSVKSSVINLNHNFKKCFYILEKHNPLFKLKNLKERLFLLENSLKKSAVSRISAYNIYMKNLIEKLNVLNPDNVLKRGYGLVFKNDKIITSANQVKSKENIEIKLKDGYINSFVAFTKLEAPNNGQDTNNA